MNKYYCDVCIHMYAYTYTDTHRHKHHTPNNIIITQPNPMVDPLWKIKPRFFIITNNNECSSENRSSKQWTWARCFPRCLNIYIGLLKYISSFLQASMTDPHPITLLWTPARAAWTQASMFLCCFLYLYILSLLLSYSSFTAAQTPSSVKCPGCFSYRRPFPFQNFCSAYNLVLPLCCFITF